MYKYIEYCRVYFYKSRHTYTQSLEMLCLQNVMMNNTISCEQKARNHINTQRSFFFVGAMERPTN